MMNKSIVPYDAGARALARPRVPTVEEGDRIEVGALFLTLWRRKWVILASMVICAVLAALAVGQITPRYTSVSKIMLDPRERRVLNNREVVGNLELREPVVNSEAAFLQSNVLLERVVQRIGYDVLAPIDPLASDPSLASRLGNLLTPILGGGGEEEVAEEPSPSFVSAEARKMERFIWAIRKDLTVYREGDSYVIAIRSVTTDPYISMLIANTLANEYIAAQLEGRTDIARRATQWLQTRVDALSTEVQEAESLVQEFRAEALILDGGTLTVASQQLAELNSQAVLARADRVAAEAQFEQFNALIEEQGIGAVADIVTSPMIQQLTTEQIALQRQDAVWADSFDEDNSRRVRLLAELEQVQEDLTREVGKIVQQRRSEVEIARIREESLAESIDQLETEIVSTARSSIGMRQLEREAAASRNTYEQMLARLNETRTQEQLQEPDARLIERATLSMQPSSPRPKLMTVVGAIGGVALGLVLVFFTELTSATFRSVQELERATRLPVLAAIPKGPWRTPRDAFQALSRDAYSGYAERIRHLRTSTLMRGGKKASRSVMMASSHPGEGKTTTALSLARMASMSGRSVLVLDCDLRRPTLHRTFGWDFKYDFADFIADRCSIEEAIHSDPELGFDVLAATAPNPKEADQLSASWLRPLIEDLKQVYDVVLVDAPALLSVSDALVLAQCVDTTLYVVRWDSTRRDDVRKGLSAFEEMGIPIDGTVLTMADPRQTGADYRAGERYV